MIGRWFRVATKKKAKKKKLYVEVSIQEIDNGYTVTSGDEDYETQKELFYSTKAEALENAVAMLSKRVK